MGWPWQGPEPVVPVNKTEISSFLAVCLFSSAFSVKIYVRGDTGSHLYAISTVRFLKGSKTGA